MTSVTPQWLAFAGTPAGRTVLAWENEAFARTASRLSGDRALQLGMPQIDTLAKCPIGHQVLVTDCDIALTADDWRNLVTAQTNALPFRNDCADLIVWPHGADAPACDPEGTLREIERVLAPSGTLITTFFNASGFWSLKSKIGASSVFPAGIAPQSTAAVKSLISRAGLALEGGFYGVYGVSKDAGKGLLPAKIDLAGNRWWPTLSNVVLLVARKKVQGMTFVGRAAFTDRKLTVNALQKN